MPVIRPVDAVPFETHGSRFLSYVSPSRQQPAVRMAAHGPGRPARCGSPPHPRRGSARPRRRAARDAGRPGYRTAARRRRTGHRRQRPARRRRTGRSRRLGDHHAGTGGGHRRRHEDRSTLGPMTRVPQQDPAVGTGGRFEARPDAGELRDVFVQCTINGGARSVRTISSQAPDRQGTRPARHRYQSADRPSGRGRLRRKAGVAWPRRSRG